MTIMIRMWRIFQNMVNYGNKYTHPSHDRCGLQPGECHTRIHTVDLGNAIRAFIPLIWGMPYAHSYR